MVNNTLNNVEFIFASKIRPLGGAVNYNMSYDDKKLIFSIRHLIETTNNPVQMSNVNLGKIVELDERRVRDIVIRLSAQGMIVAESPWVYEKDTICYGFPTLIITTRVGKEFTIPQIIVGNTPEKLLGKLDKRYYVYVCKKDDQVVYVGKGIGGRLNHCINGKSSCSGLNQAVARGDNLSVEKIADGLTEEMAIYLEEAYMIAVIKSGGSLHNTALPKEAKDFLNIELPF